MKPKNLKEARKLIKAYRQVTLSDIEQYYENIKPRNFTGTEIARALTGFGHRATCPVCTVKCSECFYKSEFACHLGENEPTHTALHNAKSPEELLKAFRNRAEHIEKILKSSN